MTTKVSRSLKLGLRRVFFVCIILCKNKDKISTNDFRAATGETDSKTKMVSCLPFFTRILRTLNTTYNHYYMWCSSV